MWSECWKIVNCYVCLVEWDELVVKVFFEVDVDLFFVLVFVLFLEVFWKVGIEVFLFYIYCIDVVVVYF